MGERESKQGRARNSWRSSSWESTDTTKGISSAGAPEQETRMRMQVTSNVEMSGMRDRSGPGQEKAMLKSELSPKAQKGPNSISSSSWSCSVVRDSGQPTNQMAAGRGGGGGG